MRWMPLAAPLASAALAAAGCGPSGVVAASGKVVKAGAPYAVPAGQTLRVTFHAAEVKDAAGKDVGAGQSYPAIVRPEDGTFTVPGPDGRGIPPGKYRVAIAQNPKAGERKAPARRGDVAPDDNVDALEGRYDSPVAPIIVGVDGTTGLTLDLDSMGDKDAARRRRRPVTD